MLNVVADANHVCVSCLETNLLQEIVVSRCAQCEKLYCTHFASNIDPAKCINCLSNVTMLKTIEIQERTYYDEEKDVVKIYKRRARKIALDGMDWLFAQRKIISMGDDSLELSIEYHRALLSGLLVERELRRAKYLHRHAGVALPVTSAPKDNSTVTTTSKKVTKKVSSTLTSAGANAMLQAMLAKGMTIEQIMKMVNGSK